MYTIAHLVLIGTAAAIDVKVFILAGQSNMEGHGVATMAAGAFDGNGTVEYSCANPSWRDLPVCATAAVPPREGCRAEAADFDGLMDENGNFTVFDDAFVVFEGSQSKRGNLTIGYGFQDAWIGPEYGMGLSLRQASDEAVLLIKWAWGGTDLEHDWRPPSAGPPPSEGGVGPPGWCYRNMTQVVHDVMENQLSDVVPGFDYATDAAEIAGFAWHQGWNDGCDETCTSDYEANLVHLISDVRDEFGVADLPVSIGLSGFGGWGQANDRRLGIMRAQYNVSTYLDRVGVVETRGFFRDFNETQGAINQGYHWFA